MTKPLALAVALLLGTITMPQSAEVGRASDGNIRDQFVGAWRLAWLEEADSEGKIHKADCTGLLVYTQDGHMSVQVMYRSLPPNANSASGPYAQGGYEASFGTYEIDDAHTFTFHVEGALVRTLIGKDLKRVYEFSGKQLVVKSSDPNEHWRVAWKRD